MDTGVLAPRPTRFPRPRRRYAARPPGRSCRRRAAGRPAPSQGRTSVAVERTRRAWPPSGEATPWSCGWPRRHRRGIPCRGLPSAVLGRRRSSFTRRSADHTTARPDAHSVALRATASDERQQQHHRQREHRARAESRKARRRGAGPLGRERGARLAAIDWRGWEHEQATYPLRGRESAGLPLALFFALLSW